MRLSAGRIRSITSADTVGDEVAPVLLESHGGRVRQAEWLAERIREIEASLGQVPTLAVFVSAESDVEPLTQELNRQFANDNLQAVACVRGQIIGQDTDVRVFDIRHVKGLEFEAAFFVGIDVLARQLRPCSLSLCPIGSHGKRDDSKLASPC